MLWHHIMIWETLLWPSSTLPYLTCWLYAAYLGPYTHFWASSDLVADALCLHVLLQLPNQNWICTHDWIRRQLALGFTWAITENCFPLLSIPLAFLLSGYLMALQMLLTILSVIILSLSGLSRPCSLTNNLAAFRLNPSSNTYPWAMRS